MRRRQACPGRVYCASGACPGYVVSGRSGVALERTTGPEVKKPPKRVVLSMIYHRISALYVEKQIQESLLKQPKMAKSVFVLKLAINMT